MNIGKKNGFTLLEAMIVVALLAILASMAYPSFQRTLASNRMSAARLEFSKALSYARSESISRNRAVGICPQSSSQPMACGTASDWSKGFLVFEDKDNNGLLTVPSATSTKGANPNDPDSILQSYYLKEPIHITVGNKVGFIWQAGGTSMKPMGSGTLNNVTVNITPSEENPTNQRSKCTLASNGHLICD